MRWSRQTCPAKISNIRTKCPAWWNWTKCPAQKNVRQRFSFSPDMNSCCLFSDEMSYEISYSLNLIFIKSWMCRICSYYCLGWWQYGCMYNRKWVDQLDLPVQSTSPPSTRAFSESTSTIFNPNSFRNTWRTTASWNKKQYMQTKLSDQDMGLVPYAIWSCLQNVSFSLCLY